MLLFYFASLASVVTIFAPLFAHYIRHEKDKERRGVRNIQKPHPEPEPEPRTTHQNPPQAEKKSQDKSNGNGGKIPAYHWDEALVWLLSQPFKNYNEVRDLLVNLDPPLFPEEPLWEIKFRRVLFILETYSSLTFREYKEYTYPAPDGMNTRTYAEYVPRSYNFFKKVVVSCEAGKIYYYSLADDRVRFSNYQPHTLNELQKKTASQDVKDYESVVRSNAREERNGWDYRQKVPPKPLLLTNEPLEAKTAELARKMQSIGHPYKDTHADYIRFLDNNFQKMDFFRFSLTWQAIKNLLLPYPLDLSNFTKAHTYIVGQSGSGKSELIKGLCTRLKKWVLIDPHGDLADELSRLNGVVRIARKEIYNKSV